MDTKSELYFLRPKKLQKDKKRKKKKENTDPL